MGDTGRDSGWRRSSKCATSECLEVKLHADYVQVRDTRVPDWPLTVTPEEWDAFLGAAKAGEFDR